ncbi:hypothetical protein JCM21900_003314 [Sporobolomyces salmonicolor]
MAYSTRRLHNPPVRLPTAARTPTHIPLAVQPLNSNRSAHIVRLYNILLHLLSLPPSFDNSTRSLRAWRALARCKEVHLDALWRLGSAVIDRTRTRNDRDEDDEEQRWRSDRKADWLKFCQEGRIDKVGKFEEYILALVAAGRAQYALDELESYLDNQPYHDSIALNTLYGLLALLLAQPPSLSDFASSTDSSDDDDERDVGGRAWRAGQGGRTAKRSRLNGGRSSTSADDDYASLLQSIALSSPAMLSNATERLKRAAQLEDRQANEAELAITVRGEAARWLALIQRHVEKPDSRQASPA